MGNRFLIEGDCFQQTCPRWTSFNSKSSPGARIYYIFGPGGLVLGETIITVTGQQK